LTYTHDEGAILRGQSHSGLPVEQLRVNAVALDETVKSIAPASAALVTHDGKDVELAHQVAELDRAVAGHHNHPSIGNPRSILRRCCLNVSPFAGLGGPYAFDIGTGQRLFHDGDAGVLEPFDRPGRGDLVPALVDIDMNARKPYDAESCCGI
jgi:hypothetical protein